MLQNGWEVYQFLGQGLLRPVSPSRPSEPGHNLMCIKPGCGLVSFLPGTDDTNYCYEFYHRGIIELNYLELLFNTTQDGWFMFPSQHGIKRELPKAILSRDGLPYLAPELVLLFKSNRLDQSSCQADFQACLPQLSDEQRQWLRHSLQLLYPEGPAGLKLSI